MNSKTKIINPDVFDKLEVEIGDTKQPKFFPQVKIKRWDNEVNASFRLIDDEPKQLVTEGEKIKLVGTKKEVHFYELPVSKELQEGGYEFEVILKEKPASNKLEFSIETKGLSFFYQPIYSDEEIALRKQKGITIYKAAMGSYAVYCSENKINYVGGKLYRAGKVGHIYRPKIIDSAGNWVWGELNIDVKKKLLTVTIPQDFLDTAIYPIRHAAGFTFGYTTIGSYAGLNIQNWVVGSTFAMLDGGWAFSLTMAVEMASGSSGDYYTKGAIYEHGDLSLKTNGVTEEVLTNYPAPGSGDWRTFNFPVSPYLGLDNFVLVGWAEYVTGYYMIILADTGFTDQLHRQSISYNGFPDPLVPSHGDYKCSIYCTYGMKWNKPFTVDGIVKIIQPKTFTIDGIVLIVQTIPFTIDGIVQETKTITFTIDGIILETKTSAFTIDGVVLVPNEKTFTIDGHVVGTGTITFTIDSLIVQRITKTFTIDGLVGPLYYFLDDDLIPRPKSLMREVIWQKQDMTTIDGKTSRDTGMRKEIYILMWEILDRENADLIMGIVERNTPVNFKVNDGKLQINEVNVIPSVPLRIYQALGSDYLEGFILILTVEQGT